MHKPAENAHPIHDLLKARWSPRAFSSQPIEDDKLLALFEAARWSASGGNSQPWSFIVVTHNDVENFAKLVSTAMGFNQVWVKNAPVLVLAVASPERPGTPTGKFSFYDVGQAVANLSVQASELGLYVHQMAGFDGEKARTLFNLPAETEPVTLFAIGYYGKLDDLPEELRAREVLPRTRKPLSEFVFGPEWGAPLQVAQTATNHA